MALPGVQEGNIPLYAEKLLFAEDFVNFMMNDVFEISYFANSAAHYREFIYNAFNETVKQAVASLHSQVEMSMFRFLFGPDEFDVWDGSTFSHIAIQIHASRFSEGFEAKEFLLFCIELSFLARKFRDKGLEGAPDLAVYLIFVSLREYNMFLGGWDSLNITAANYVTIFNDQNRMLTPDSFASEISDNELRKRLHAISDCSSSGSDYTSQNASSGVPPPQEDPDKTNAHGVPPRKDKDETVVSVANEDERDAYLESLFYDDGYEEEEDLEHADVQMRMEDEDSSSGVDESDKCVEVHGISSGQIRDKARMQMDDSGASSDFSEEGDVLLPYIYEENVYLDPGGASQTKINDASSGLGAKEESELRTVSLKNTSVMSKEVSPGNLALSFASIKDKSLQSSFEFKRVEGDYKSSTIEIHEVCFKNTSNISEELNSKSRESAKDSNVQPNHLFQDFGACHTAEHNCKSLASEDGARASISQQSPWLFSSISSSSQSSSPFTEQALSSSNGLELHQTDSEAVNNPQKLKGLKRFPERDCELSHEKKLKLS